MEEIKQENNQQNSNDVLRGLEKLKFLKKKNIIIGLIIVFLIGLLFYLNSYYLWSANLFSDNNHRVVNLGKEFKVELYDIVRTKNGDVEIKIVRFKPDMAMGWGGSALVEYEYIISGEKGKTGHALYLKGAFTKNGYRITVIKSDFKSYAIMKIEEDYNKIRDCNWMSNREARERCYYDVAKNIKDEAPCDEMWNDWRRDSCYKYVAPYKKDISICDKIIDVPQKYRCYAGVARETKNFDLCKRTEDGRYFKISECYSEVAKALGNFFTRESIENWLVYNNSGFEYEIKYPRDLLVSSNSSDSLVVIGFQDLDEESKHSSLGLMSKIEIRVEENKNMQEIIDKIKAKKEETKIYINNKKATHISYKGMYANERHIVVLIENYDYIYKINYADSEQYGSTFEQILSTFTIIK